MAGGNGGPCSQVPEWETPGQVRDLTSPRHPGPPSPHRLSDGQASSPPLREGVGPAALNGGLRPVCTSLAPPGDGPYLGEAGVGGTKQPPSLGRPQIPQCPSREREAPPQPIRWAGGTRTPHRGVPVLRLWERLPAPRKGLHLTAHERMPGPVQPLHFLGLGPACAFRPRACMELRSSWRLLSASTWGWRGFFFCLRLFAKCPLKTHQPVLASEQRRKVRQSLIRRWK